jgi:hypothetical protein
LKTDRVAGGEEAKVDTALSSLLGLDCGGGSSILKRKNRHWTVIVVHPPVPKMIIVCKVCYSYLAEFFVEFIQTYCFFFFPELTFFQSSSDELSRIIARMIADRIRIKPDLVCSRLICPAKQFHAPEIVCFFPSRGMKFCFSY